MGIDNKRKSHKKCISLKHLTLFSASAMAAFLGVSSFTGESTALAMPLSVAPLLTLAAAPGSQAGTTDVTEKSSAITVTSAKVSYVDNGYFTVTLNGTNLPQLTGATSASQYGEDYQNIVIVQQGTGADWASTVFNSGNFGNGSNGDGITSISSETSTKLSFTVTDPNLGLSPDSSLVI